MVFNDHSETFSATSTSGTFSLWMRPAAVFTRVMLTMASPPRIRESRMTPPKPMASFADNFKCCIIYLSLKFVG